MQITGIPRRARVRMGLLAWLLALGLSLLGFSCAEAPTPPPQGSDARTLSSLRRVDDYPFYVMRYYGDYDLAQAATSGSAVHGLGLAPASVARERSFSCTTLSTLNPDGECLLGRNFDWHNHMALLLYTDPGDGFASVSMVDLSYLGFVPGDESAANKRRLLRAPSWPFDGMNEKGLTVGMMAVPHAEGGHDSGKPTIGSLAAIRLLLDRAADVDAAVALLGHCNIDFRGGPPVHYLVSDTKRRSAVIEFLDDTMRVIPADTLWQVATNFILSGQVPCGSPSGCWRYDLAASQLAARNGTLTSAEAMKLLSTVSQSNTMWSVVYGGAGGQVEVALGRDYGSVHRFRMEELCALR